MAPVLCIMTTGDMHHEDALQGRSRYRYVSALLLFSHHRYELNVRLRLGVAEVLRAESDSGLRDLTAGLVFLPRITTHAMW